jgi:hypothetical protein
VIERQQQIHFWAALVEKPTGLSISSIYGESNVSEMVDLQSVELHQHDVQISIES